MIAAKKHISIIPKASIACFLFCTFLQVFSYFYVHMDASLFWENPIAYFQWGDFYYTFILSTELGLIGVLLPASAALITASVLYSSNAQRMGTDLKSEICQGIKTAGLCAANSCIALWLFTGIIAIFCTMTRQDSGNWQILAGQYAYGWRAESSHFWIFIIECSFRIALSAMTWSCIAILFWVSTNKREFVVWGTVCIGAIAEKIIKTYVGESWTITYLQVPPVTNQTNLVTLYCRQFVYLGIALAAIFCALMARQIFSHHIHTVHSIMHRFWAKVKVKVSFPKKCRSTSRTHIRIGISDYFAPYSLFVLLLTPVICTILISEIDSTSSSLGGHLINLFGGMSWGYPVLNVSRILPWMVLCIAPIIGVLTKEKKNAARSFTKNECIIDLFYAFVACAILFSASFLVWLIAGGQDASLVSVYNDEYYINGFFVLFLLYVTYSLQVVFTIEVYRLARLVTGKNIGLWIHCTLQFMLILLGSNADILGNMYLQPNWGMMLRSSLFCSTSTSTLLEDGTSFQFSQCSILYSVGLIAQITTIVLIILVAYLFLIYRLARQEKSEGFAD